MMSNDTAEINQINKNTAKPKDKPISLIRVINKGLLAAIKKNSKSNFTNRRGFIFAGLLRNFGHFITNI